MDEPESWRWLIPERLRGDVQEFRRLNFLFAYF